MVDVDERRRRRRPRRRLATDPRPFERRTRIRGRLLTGAERGSVDTRHAADHTEDGLDVAGRDRRTSLPRVEWSSVADAEPMRFASTRVTAASMAVGVVALRHRHALRPAQWIRQPRRGRALFAVKTRRRSGAVPLIAASIEQAQVAGSVRRRGCGGRAFWPGPLTLGARAGGLLDATYSAAPDDGGEFVCRRMTSRERCAMGVGLLHDGDQREPSASAHRRRIERADVALGRS